MGYADGRSVLVGPIQVDWDTPGAVDPDNCLLIGNDIPVGSTVELFVVVTDIFDDDATVDVGVSDGGVTFVSSISSYAVNQIISSSYAKLEAIVLAPSAAVLATNLPRKVRTTAPCRLAIAVWSGTGSITRGSLEVYAYISTP